RTDRRVRVESAGSSPTSLHREACFRAERRQSGWYRGALDPSRLVPVMLCCIARRTTVGYPKARVDERAGDDAVPSQPSFPKQEDSVLAYWAKDRTFQESIDARPAGKNGANEFVFYDGPPFANG